MSDITISAESPNQITITTPGPAGTGVPAGGTTGQVLAKNSNTDYDTEWVTGGGGGGSGDVVGPASSANDRLAAFDGVTGKLIKDSGATVAGIVALIPTTTSELTNDSNFATTGDVTSAQVFAIQRANHTGTQNVSTITGLGTLATQSGTFSGTSSGTNTGDQTISLTGDVTGSGTGSFAATVANNAITNAKAAQVATSTIKGRVTAGTGNVEDLTGTQATTLLDTFTTSLKGLVPASGGGTTNFLRADGTFAAPPGGGGGHPNIQFQDEGSNLGGAGSVDTLNFTGAGVTASRTGNTVTVDVPASGGGSGDVVGPASSIDSEVVLFDSTTGKLIKRATGTGVAKLTSGVLSAGSIDLTSEVSGVLPNANGGKFTPIVNNYTSSTTMADPGVGCTTIRLRGIGAGGGGGSGRKQATNAGRAGGGGGSAGAYFDVILPYSSVPSWPVTITIGAGGVGGASATATNQNGNDGSAGGDTSFGSILVFQGGLGGAGGGGAVALGGEARIGSSVSSSGLNSSVNKAGGQSSTTTSTIYPGANGFAGSGGGGGGLTTSNALATAQPGGASPTQAGGAVDTAGANGDTTNYLFFGGAGGGGGSASTTTKFDGGAGGLYGAGGGGGNGGTNAVSDSGAGGAGADGFLQVIAR